uniref:Uncharacterized protein n=1 Tax=Arundo donax TaxID=35708 RepID=A0A0A9AB31_ARUDO
MTCSGSSTFSYGYLMLGWCCRQAQWNTVQACELYH